MKIIELTLPTTNIDRQENLFSKVLGFECVRTKRDRLNVKCGANVLSFVSSNRQFYFHYCFLVPPGCIESAACFLDHRGLDPLTRNGQPVVDFENGKAIYFLDGDGNLAEFIERPSLGYAQQSSFEISDVIRLNEIGMPSARPLDFAKELIDQFGIEIVEGGIYRDDFVWCGDYEGVFLIPEIGRNWIPCDKPAEANELAVKFETDVGAFTCEVKLQD